MRIRTLVLTAVACAGLAACGQGGSAGSGSKAQAPAKLDPALLASYPAPYNTADIENGERKFGMCRSCHSIAPGGPNMTGPNLHGVFGRKAAQAPGYNYSEALKTHDIVWDAAHLDQWLANPRTYLPGTKMSFAGLSDAKDRTDLIAYLMLETGYKPAAGEPAPPPPAAS
jgi:cytochrome c